MHGIDLRITLFPSRSQQGPRAGFFLLFALPPLQHYIQHALIAPREREAKRAAATAAASAVPDQRETVVEANGTTSTPSSDAKGSNSMGKSNKARSQRSLPQCPPPPLTVRHVKTPRLARHHRWWTYDTLGGGYRCTYLNSRTSVSGDVTTPSPSVRVLVITLTH